VRGEGGHEEKCRRVSPALGGEKGRRSEEKEKLDRGEGRGKSQEKWGGGTGKRDSEMKGKNDVVSQTEMKTQQNPQKTQQKPQNKKKAVGAE